jgi:hypothetical protein
VVWIYLILQFTCFLITNGLSTFSNIIVKGLGFSTAQTQLLNLAQGGWSVMIFVGESATRFRDMQRSHLTHFTVYCTTTPALPRTVRVQVLGTRTVV